MDKIKRNSKIFYIIFGFIDVLLLLATVFLLIAALLFRGSSAPALFGHNVFLVTSDAFAVVKKGSVLIVDKVETSEIAPGNIIIFTDDEEYDRIGEVQTVGSDDGIYTFTVRNDADNNVTVGQSHIVGKAVYYSEILGAVVSFATSPAGVCLIAILPCTAFVIFEIIGMVKRRAPQPEVTTVKKQYETPTYLPPAMDENESPAFAPERKKLVEAAGLFTQPPVKKSEPPPPPPKPEEKAPISGRDIDKLIREAKAKHERDVFTSSDEPEPKHRTAAVSEQYQSRPTPAPTQYQSRQAAVNAYRTTAEERPGIEITPEDEKPHTALEVKEKASERPREKAEETVRQYVPPKKPTVKLTSRISRLDSLLREDSGDGDSQYNIDDILRNFEDRRR